MIWLYRKKYISVYIVMIFGVCVVESVESPLNGRWFINKNFWNKQAPSAEVIYNDALHTQRRTADSTGTKISHVALQITAVKHKSVIFQTHSLTIRVENDHSSKHVELFIVELGVQNSQFRQWFWNIRGKSRFLLMLQTRVLNFLKHSFFARNVAKLPNLAELSPKCRQAPLAA